MKLRVIHSTEYNFSKYVFLEPHILRFYPRELPSHTISGFTIRILPEPAGNYEFLDYENNSARMVWFNGEHNNLKIKSNFIIEINRKKNLDFLIYPFEFTKFPIKYPGEYGLEKFLENRERQPEAVKVAKELYEKFNQSSSYFLIKLTDYLYHHFTIVNREKGPPLKPDETLHNKTGSCRDLAVLMMYLLRENGIASRFVSGYLYNHGEEEDHELHAWVEAYIPGAGWLGADPTAGLLTEYDHIAVCASFLPSNTMPVIGTYRADATSSMKSNVHISLLHD